MINIVTFKWKKAVSQTGGYDLPMAVDQYTSQHVNILYNSIKRNTTVDFKFTCVTDDPTGLDPKIHYVPLWDECRDMGGCYNRLYVFSNDIKDILGDRFMCIDLDTVIVGNVDHLLTMKEDFVIKLYGTKELQHKLRRRSISGYKQYYNGGLFMMNAGARSQVWDDFEFEKSDKLLSTMRENKNLPKHSLERKQYSLVGSDQAWISYKLGLGEKTVNNDEGIYSYQKMRNKEQIPNHACMIMFPGGAHDPATLVNSVGWINKYWKM